MPDVSRKLLVIDDDTIVRESIAAYLEDSGFEVHEAGEGYCGLENFHQNLPELVICDLKMPGLDGLQVLKAIHEYSREIPVIVISGAGVMSDVVEALRLGASDYLIKPVVDMEVLVHSVKKSLERVDLLKQNRRYREELENANRDLKEHVRVLERDQKAGRKVQTNLLPPTPLTFGGYTVAHHIVPSLYLSGDFIDYTYLSNRFLPFYLSDVSGHGASSAFVTIWLKHLVTHMVRDEFLFCDETSFNDGPNMLLKALNTELRETNLNSHLTCFTGVIDTETNIMRYAVGGHLPMPVFMAQGHAPVYLPGKGKPVGIFADAQWDVYELELPPRFSLIGFSDGVLEILPPSDLSEKEEYLLELLSKEEGSLKSVCSALALSGLKEAPDDIAILTVGKGE